MVSDPTVQLFAGAVALGAVHGAEPGHGWPVAATYAMEKSHRWLSGLAASAIIGIGHLVSSIAMVVVFFLAKSYFSLTRVNEPFVVFGAPIGGPVDVVAGVVLVALGIREYRHGRSHGHSEDQHSHDHGDGGGHAHEHDGSHAHEAHSHADHEHGHAHDDHDHDHGSGGVVPRLLSLFPGVDLSDGHESAEEAAERGLWGIASFAFLLGFAHEEEFEIIALCLGSSYCLELMLAYALTVIAGIVGLTLLLIAGYERYEQRVSHYAQYFPVVSAVVLVAMGLGFVAGLF